MFCPEGTEPAQRKRTVNLMKKSNKIKSLMAKQVLAALSLMILAAPNAMAIINDPMIASQLVQKRHTLIVKEQNILRDVDNLLRDIDELTRRKDQQSAAEINELSKKLDKKSYDLRQVRLDLRDVDMQLL